MLHDIRLALRSHLRRPMFALLIVMLLAIGVGANTFVLSLVEAVLLRPFEFNDQNRLTMLWLRDRTRNVSFVEMSYPDYIDIRQRSRTFADLAAMRTYHHSVDNRQLSLRPARLEPMQALRQE